MSGKQQYSHLDLQILAFRCTIILWVFFITATVHAITCLSSSHAFSITNNKQMSVSMSWCSADNRWCQYKIEINSNWVNWRSYFAYWKCLRLTWVGTIVPTYNRWGDYCPLSKALKLSAHYHQRQDYNERQHIYMCIYTTVYWERKDQHQP